MRARRVDVYDLLDTYALYCPALLLPADRIAHETPPLPLASWSPSLVHLALPAMAPGLTVAGAAASRVPRAVQLGMLVGVNVHDPSTLGEVRLSHANEAAGQRLAASLGRLVATDYVYQRPHTPLDGVPPFSPTASALLVQLYYRCAALGGVPATLFSFVGHVIHSMGADAVEQLRAGNELTAWEAVWRPSMRALVRLVGLLAPSAWSDIFPRMLRPLCHLAAMDGVSDAFSAAVLTAHVRLLRHWTRRGADTSPLVACLLELEEALVLEGDASLPLYYAALDLHAVLTEAGLAEATAMFPYPFVQLASPPALAGSIATLARLCAIVTEMRTLVLSAKKQHAPPCALDPSRVDDMTAMLVDMLWSGRAFSVLLQRGIVIDGVTACDRSAVLGLRQACDMLRAVPFMLVASLTHSAFLAALFERFCNEAFLPPHPTRPFIRAPIIPTALAAARDAGLPPNLKFSAIRRQFLEWLAARGAAPLLELLQAAVQAFQPGQEAGPL
mgnify:CR=1 FL=1